MGIRAEPHYRITSAALADWLEQQGADRWWNVDGDPVLAGRLSLPCPADELAAELRNLDRTLLVRHRGAHPTACGQLIGAAELDALAARLGDNVPGNGTRPRWVNDRLFDFCWEDRGDDWLLVEDGETTERSRLDAASGAIA